VATGELLKNGRRIPLERQPFLILTFLLDHPGELVARDRLRSVLWPDGTFVDFDRGLNACKEVA
jgi:DNA-binding winged helix-turn-helix (wHTH) protein